MLPTLVPIPRRVRLRPGRFTAPPFVGWLLQGVMLCALYDVIRPLWVMFCLCTKGHSINTLPLAPWDVLLGLNPQTPVQCLIQIALAGVVIFPLSGIAEVLVWRGQREKQLLVAGRAMNATVTKVRSEGSKHWLTYSLNRDGTTVEKEARCVTRKTVGEEVIVLFSFNYSQEMLYELCRYELETP